MLDGRPMLLSAAVERHRGDVVCRVVIEVAGTFYEGASVGQTRHDQARLAAEATATALSGLQSLSKITIRGTSWVPMVDAEILQVRCTIGGRAFLGTCVNRGRTPAETGARAVLDALNAATGHG